MRNRHVRGDDNIRSPSGQFKLQGVSDLAEKTHGSTQRTDTAVWVTVAAVGYCGLRVWVTGEGGVAVVTALFATVTVGYGLL